MEGSRHLLAQANAISVFAMRPDRSKLLIGLGLVLMILVVYGQVCGKDYEFVNFDDETYVTSNPEVRAGLTAKGIAWAFTTFRADNWHPLTWLSLQLDADLYGVNAWGFHLTNVLLHCANAVLLFLILRRMTGALWRSGLVAALFAVHPLHVESVAWIAERKDVLSTLFGMLALGAYLRYAEHPGLARYLLVLLAYALSLLAKPMLVTLPFLLLLLDYWPLRRFSLAARDVPAAGPTHPPASVRLLVGEKLPLLGLALCSSAITMTAQGHLRGTLEEFPLSVRVWNALVAYVRYLGKLLWPSDLAPFYPHSAEQVSTRAAILAGVLLLFLSVLALRAARTKPYLLVGWLWFLGTLVPVIGLVQVGNQAIADRYTYLPSIGLFIILVWGMADVAARWRCLELTVALGGLLLLPCLLCSWLQVNYWHDSITLWKHTIDVSPPNASSYLMLGCAFDEKGRIEEAVACYQEALRIDARFIGSYYQLGLDLEKQGRLEEAAQCLARYVGHEPQGTVGIGRDSTPGTAHYHLGRILGRQGKLPEAVGYLTKGAEVNPSHPGVRSLLGLFLAEQGKPAQALPNLRRAVELNPSDVEYRCNFAYALYSVGQTDAAAEQYAESLRLNPDWPEAVNRAAWNLATSAAASERNGPAALRRAQQVCQATGYRNPEFLDTLAAAYAEAGNYDQAVATARKAQTLASATLPERNEQIRQRLRLYENRRPFHQEPGEREASTATRTAQP
jgi:tetratricopeptide (TPR) repeat protein